MLSRGIVFISLFSFFDAVWIVLFPLLDLAFQGSSKNNKKSYGMHERHLLFLSL